MMRNVYFCFFSYELVLQESVLEFGSFIHPLQSVGGAIVSDSTGKTAVLNPLFDGNQSRFAVDCPVSCHCSSKLDIFAFRYLEVRMLVSNIDPLSRDLPQ